MVTFIFCTKNDAAALARSLMPLVHDAVEGHISEVVVVDSDSSDATRDVADASGCRLLDAGKGVLRDAVERARGDWLIFLEPGARPAHGWADAVMEHAMRPDAAAACFSRKREGNWIGRLFSPVLSRPRPLALGLVISKSQALSQLSPDAARGEDVIRGLALRPLDATIEPAPAKAG